MNKRAYSFHPVPHGFARSKRTATRIGMAQRFGWEHDRRWPQIARALVDLREAGRYSVRIVDADCGAGTLLVGSVLHARALGFTAIEGRGIDGAPSLIARARHSAVTVTDPAIGLSFEVSDMLGALGEEAEFPADIVLWHDRTGWTDHESAERAIGAAGYCVIGDSATTVATGAGAAA